MKMTLSDRIGLIFLKIGARFIQSDIVKFDINEIRYEMTRKLPKHYRWDEFVRRLP